MVLSGVEVSEATLNDELHLLMLKVRSPAQFVASSWSPLGMSSEVRAEHSRVDGDVRWTEQTGCLLALASSDGAITLHDMQNVVKPVHSLSRSVHSSMMQADARQLSLSRDDRQFASISQLDGAEDEDEDEDEDGKEEAEEKGEGEGKGKEKEKGSRDSREKTKSKRAQQPPRRSKKSSAGDGEEEVAGKGVCC